MSFGFGYGIPVDADLVADMRFLPNPFWVPELKAHTGQDADVEDTCHEPPGSEGVLDKYTALL